MILLTRNNSECKPFRAHARGENVAVPSGERAFPSIISPTKDYDIRRERKRAGSREETRSNPSGLTYMGTRDPGRQDRAAHCFPGAAPALTPDYSGSSFHKTFVVLGAMVGVLYLAHRAKAA